jgi:hypothetical protein
MWKAFGVAAMLAATLLSCSDDGDSSDGRVAHKPPARMFRDVGIDVRARIPAGWHILDSGVVGTRLAATSFAVSGGGLQAACDPERILRQMPPDGALVAIDETNPLVVGPAQFRDTFPPRPSRFRLPSRPGRYACGVAYNLFFRDSGRGMQARVWVRPRTFSEQRRREVMELLDSLQIGPLLRPTRPTPEQLRRAVIGGARSDFRQSLQLGPRSFETCLLSALRRKLTNERLRELRRDYFRFGQARVARTLNGMAVMPADRCGRREWVPQLVEASMSLAG